MRGQCVQQQKRTGTEVLIRCIAAASDEAKGELMSAKTVVIAQDKGGAGKTTTAIAFSAERALCGERVLAIDWDKSNPSFTQVLCTDDELTDELYDPQNTTARLVTNPNAGIHKLVRRVDLSFEASYRGKPRYPVSQLAAVWQERAWKPGVGVLDFIPGHRMLGAALAELEGGSWGRQDPGMTLSRALAKARDQYDWIIIDMGPGNTDDDMGVVNALEAADGMFFPLNFMRTAQAACKYAITHAREYSAQRLSRGRPALAIIGIGLFGYKQGKVTHDDKLDAYRRSSLFKPYLLDAIVPHDSIVEDAQDAGAPVQLYAPFSPASVAYHQLAQEVVTRDHSHILA